MADLSIDFAGIKAPNPFWLASAPPTNSGYQIMKAFDAGWGGAVWKTLGVPVVNVSSRYGGVNYRDTRLMGLNNIELISDRPLSDNLREITEVKKHFPNHAVIASLWLSPKKNGTKLLKWLKMPVLMELNLILAVHMECVNEEWVQQLVKSQKS